MTVICGERRKNNIRNIKFFYREKQEKALVVRCTFWRRFKCENLMVVYVSCVTIPKQIRHGVTKTKHWNKFRIVSTIPIEYFESVQCKSVFKTVTTQKTFNQFLSDGLSKYRNVRRARIEDLRESLIPSKDLKWTIINYRSGSTRGRRKIEATKICKKEAGCRVTKNQHCASRVPMSPRKSRLKRDFTR